MPWFLMSRELELQKNYTIGKRKNGKKIMQYTDN